VLIKIEPNGDVMMIYSDDMAALLEEGTSHVERASHVEPAPGGGWTADMAPVDGPVLGPFHLRADALAAEVKWLEDRLFS
jgi:hypothetical protein